MQEVLAENLQSLFDNTDLNGICTYKGEWYEVWEISDDDFKKMCDMEEPDFTKVCPDGMWRSAIGSNMGTPCVKWNINNKDIWAWDGSRRENYYHAYCEDCSGFKSGKCKATENDILECGGERKADTLLRYFCDEMGASQPRNVCALAVDLANANHMKLSELFNTYEG